MKKILFLLMAVAMIFAMMNTATAEEDVYLRLEGGSGNVGDLVTVSAIAENAPECQSFYLLLEYDPAILEPVSVDVKVNMSADFSSIKFPYKYDGKTVVYMEVSDGVGAVPLISGNAPLVDVVFRIKAETPGYFGTKVQPVYYTSFTPFVIGGVKPQVYPEYKGGQVCVGVDERLSTAHAVEIMRHLIGKTLPADRAEELDWDGNGTLNIADATLLLRELN